MKYTVKLSDRANADFDNYINHIIYEYDAPITASKHHDGIIEILLGLSENPYKNAVRNNNSLHPFGENVRRANFKKMAIIYTIHGNIVYIHRILAASMITD
ncbi:MAG: type II toxin-antitoxin system RelE/ParE family toxin [Bacteroidetes bacterium]|nr:type II toxin-antitoxin system RelE/ParE family toxin [Bacteroidota bacterium]